MLVVVVSLLLVQGIIAASPPNIITSCNAQSSYNLAVPSLAYFTCTLNVISLPDYSYAGVNINACPPDAWPTYDWDRCLPSDCGLNWESHLNGPLSTVCNTTVPAGWTYEGVLQMKMMYWGKNSGGAPFYTRELGNFTIVNDPSMQCPLGQAYQKSNPYCSNCTKGTFSADGTACKVCPIGTVGTAAGLSSCTPCAPGYYGGGGATACSVAPAGFYSVGGVYRSTACPPGTYAPTIASSACLICPNGTTSCAAASSCSPCPAGKISSAGASFCVACPPGTYAPQTGSASCTPCPANTYSASLAATSATSCTACPAGTTLQGCAHSQICCM